MVDKTSPISAPILKGPAPTRQSSYSSVNSHPHFYNRVSMRWLQDIEACPDENKLLTTKLELGHELKRANRKAPPCQSPKLPIKLKIPLNTSEIKTPGISKIGRNGITYL